MNFDAIFVIGFTGSIGLIFLIKPSILNGLLLYQYKWMRMIGLAPKDSNSFKANIIYIRIFGLLWLLISIWILTMLLTDSLPKQV